MTGERIINSMHLTDLVSHQVDTGDPGTFLEARFLMILMHREIKEERKSGNFSGEIRIGPKRLYCAVAVLNISVPPLFKIGRICQHFISHSKFYKESMNL